MIFTEEPRYEFYPDIQDNLSKPEHERLAVEIIRPTGYMRKEFVTTVATREYYRDDQPVDDAGNERVVKKLKKVTLKMQVDADYILRNCVGKITNMRVETVGKDGKKAERVIADGAALAECRAYGTEDLVSAIVVEVQSDTITDSKKKNIA